MIKIVIWGTGKTAVHLINVLDKDECEIIAFFETEKRHDIFYNKPVMELHELGNIDFDYLFIASVYFEEILERIRENYEIPANKIINFKRIYRELGCRKDESVWRLFTKDFVLKDCKRTSYYMGEKYMPYQSCVANDLIFFHDSHDDTILKYMIDTGNVWEKENIDLFIRVAEKYYGISPDEHGYFLDIGANIGTTCLYVLKELCPNMKAIAFEPVSKVFSLLKANVEFNGLSDRCQLEEIAISDEQKEGTIYLNRGNLGGNTLLEQLEYSGLNSENIQCNRLDNYVKDNHLDINLFKYIWIDVEGLELQVLKGAMPILKEKPIPIYMEFNPMCYDVALLESIFNDLASIYTRFIDVNECSLNLEEHGIAHIMEKADEKQSDIILLP